MTEKSDRPAFVYIVECADGSLYTGWTYNPVTRVQQHNAGTGARYTLARRPVRLIYTETLPSQQAAQQREYAIKQLTRSQKLKLIEGWQPDAPAES